jgi:hypothetical protein
MIMNFKKVHRLKKCSLIQNLHALKIMFINFKKCSPIPKMCAYWKKASYKKCSSIQKIIIVLCKKISNYYNNIHRDAVNLLDFVDGLIVVVGCTQHDPCHPWSWTRCCKLRHRLDEVIEILPRCKIPVTLLP